MAGFDWAAFFRRMVVAVSCAFCTAYFGYNAVFGDRGLQAMAATEAEIAVLKEELASLQETRRVWERRVELLSGDEVDADLLDERVRAELHLTAEGDIIVPRP